MWRTVIDYINGWTVNSPHWANPKRKIDGGFNSMRGVNSNIILLFRKVVQNANV